MLRITNFQHFGGLSRVLLVLALLIRRVSTVLWIASNYLQLGVRLWRYGLERCPSRYRYFDARQLSTRGWCRLCGSCIYERRWHQPRTAGAIVTNALVVAAGFSVLTLAASPPIKVMGALTAIAMVLAAMTLMVYTLTGRKSGSMKGTTKCLDFNCDDCCGFAGDVVLVDMDTVLTHRIR